MIVENQMLGITMSDIDRMVYETSQQYREPSFEWKKEYLPVIIGVSALAVLMLTMRMRKRRKQK